MGQTGLGQITRLPGQLSTIGRQASGAIQGAVNNGLAQAQRFPAQLQTIGQQGVGIAKDLANQGRQVAAQLSPLMSGNDCIFISK